MTATPKGPGRHVRDLAGEIFDRLTAIKRAGTANGKAMWECLCACGAIVHIRGDKLVQGVRRSCGCAVGSRATTDGAAAAASFAAWQRLAGALQQQLTEKVERIAKAEERLKCLQLEVERLTKIKNQLWNEPVGDRPLGAIAKRRRRQGDGSDAGSPGSTR